MLVEADIGGVIAKIQVEVGDEVEEGATLLCVESMKMEIQVESPSHGVVAEVFAQLGDLVEEGQALVRLAPKACSDPELLVQGQPLVYPSRLRERGDQPTCGDRIQRISAVDHVSKKFNNLGIANAPGQELRLGMDSVGLLAKGEPLLGRRVDFSHGDVDAFTPTPGALDIFTAGFATGGAQAYTEYRGEATIRAEVAGRLATFTGSPVSADDLIVTTGTQGALFLAIASTVSQGTLVAIVRPDYFANRKLVEFMGGTVVPIGMNYLETVQEAGIDLQQLEDAFLRGVTVFLFSNPNNPAGVLYSAREVRAIAKLAQRHGVTVIVDQLYSRLVYDSASYAHLRAEDIDPQLVMTIMGPSKTESLSGFRLGVGFGAARLIERMEKLQSIVALRAAGYNQAVLRTWFAEPSGWMQARTVQHQSIRDGILECLSRAEGVRVRTPQGGSYVFPMLPELTVDNAQFVHLLRLQAQVIVAPGGQFGEGMGHSIRLNFSQDESAALDAVDRIVELLERYRQ